MSFTHLREPQMNSMTSIVAATDLSNLSRHAVRRSAQLADDTGAELSLVHALVGTALDDLRGWGPDGAAAATAVEAAARQQLHALALELQQKHTIAVREQVAFGHPVTAVTEHASDSDADLIVTGTRGTGFFRGVVVGSTAERIARRAARPVLMVRQSPRGAYRRVLVPIDFSPSSIGAIALARQVAPEATLVLMHAVELPYEGKLRLAGVSDASIVSHRDAARHDALRRLQDVAAGSGMAPEQVRIVAVAGGDPWMLIVQEEEEQDCDLVAIGKQGRHALGELLLGSTARMVIAECTSDVLLSCSRSP